MPTIAHVNTVTCTSIHGISHRISLARSVEDVPKDENMVVQEYLDKVRAS